MNHLLIVSHDVVGSRMAGPGIRYYHLARVLARELPVTLALPAHSTNDLAIPGVTLATYTPQAWASLAPLFKRATVALMPSDIVAHYPEVAATDTALVIDGYNPVLAEWLAVHSPSNDDSTDNDPTDNHLTDDIRAQWQQRIAQQAAMVRQGDFFICASERQRDWWLGQLEAHGRINPATYGLDPTLRRLVDVVPYGLPAEPPVATRPIIKGVWNGIAPTDKVVLWGGGLWPWLDPHTAIHAIHLLAASRPEIKLIFPGTRHPNRDVAAMPTHLTAAKNFADHCGLTDRQVFFGDWVDYRHWPSVLLESDVALTLHADSVEARLAFRSRVLEYVWASLPVVATAGDATSDLLTHYGLSIPVQPGDAQSVAAAIVALVDEDRTTRAAGFAAAQRELSWERTIAPLLAFCQSPRRAPDLNAPGQASWLSNPETHAHQVNQLQAEVEQWRELVALYERGRFIRAAQIVARVRRKFFGKSDRG